MNICIYMSLTNMLSYISKCIKLAVSNMSKYMWHIYGNLYDPYIWLPYMPVYEKAIHFLVYEMIYVVHICPSPICCHMSYQYVVIYVQMYFRIYFKILQNWPSQIYVAHIWQLIWLPYMPVYEIAIHFLVYEMGIYFSVYACS